MKIAIATNQGMVSQHFGYSEVFTLYEVENNRIVDKKEVENPGHRPGVLPVFLANLGVNVIIVGGMGSGAIELFDARHIAIVTGASGTIDSVIEKWMASELKSTGSICNEHQHHQEC